ncbi:acetyltransferase, GNAT family [Purpureocillium lavendulum]|uniref:Acetyltransferase, GNAT family n=1 Tax=Purpureocillium lavendulum TaxID=1247861 RepID=A0AB34FIK8_9HYPO|nr:acetyltransferase, GNAT family [Purpureocillium lavendulum]
MRVAPPVTTEAIQFELEVAVVQGLRRSGVVDEAQQDATLWALALTLTSFVKPPSPTPSGSRPHHQWVCLSDYNSDTACALSLARCAVIASCSGTQNTMAFAVRTATHDDVEALCDVYLSAFRDEIFSRQVFPRDSPTAREYWRRAFAEELQEPDATFLVAVEQPPSSPATTSASSVVAAEASAPRGEGVILGFVKWVAPAAPPHDFSEDGYPADGLPDVAALYYKRLFEGHRRAMGDVSHWYLDMIGVRPEAMGRGAARQLMGWGFERARQDGRPCFVESTGDAQAFYHRFGFRELDRMSVDTPQGEAVVVLLVASGLVPHGLENAPHGPALARARVHIGLELLEDGGQGLGLVLFAHLLVNVLAVDEPELVLGVLEPAVELVKGLGVARAAAIDADGEDALVGNLGDTLVEARAQADVARGLAGGEEDLQLRQRFVDVRDELGDGAGGDAKVLDHVLVGEARLVQGVVAGAAVEEGVGEAAGERVLRHMEVLEGELAAPEGAVVVAEEVVFRVHVDGRGLLRRGPLVEDVLDGVGEPVDLHLLEDLVGRWRLVDEAAEHDGDAALAEVDAVDEVDGIVLGGGLEDVVGLSDVLDELQVDLDVGGGGDELDGEEGDDAKGSEAAGGVLEQVGVVGAAGGLEGAVAEDNLNVGDGVVEEAVAPPPTVMPLNSMTILGTTPWGRQWAARASMGTLGSARTVMVSRSTGKRRPMSLVSTMASRWNCSGRVELVDPWYTRKCFLAS